MMLLKDKLTKYFPNFFCVMIVKNKIFLNIIVIKNESLVHNYDPETKDSQWSFVIRLHHVHRSLKFKRQLGKSC
jgi:hypothetical protein